MENIEKPMSMKQASEFTGYKVNSIYQMTRVNKIPHHKVDRKLFFYASELNDWIKSKKKQQANL